jgi:hypothetical protein
MCSGVRNDLEVANHITCSRSSNSLAVICFKEEAFLENFRMVSRPNVGICRYLIIVSIQMDKRRYKLTEYLIPKLALALHSQEFSTGE